MGGNKLRKLEYLVADALAQGCDTLVSIGGVQSNHTRSVAAAAAVAGLQGAARAGELGRLARRRLRPRRQHPAQPDHGRRGRARALGVQHRRQGELAARDRRGPRARRAPLPHPGRRLGPPARRPGLRELRARGRAPGGGARRLLRPRRRVHGDRQHAGGHDRRLRRRRAPAPRARHRRVGAHRGDARRGGADRPRHGASGSGWAATCATTRSRSSRASRASATASRWRRRSTRSASPAAWRGWSATRSTRASRWRASSGWSATARSPPEATVLYVHLGGAPALNAYSALF